MKVTDLFHQAPQLTVILDPLADDRLAVPRHVQLADPPALAGHQVQRAVLVARDAAAVGLAADDVPLREAAPQERGPVDEPVEPRADLPLRGAHGRARQRLV